MSNKTETVRTVEVTRYRGLWIKATVTLILVVVTGVGAWAVISKLDDTTFKVIVGVVLTLVIVIVVGGLFIGKDVVQAYIMRRMLAQDDRDDMRHMAIMAQAMRGGRSDVHVIAPGQAPQVPAWTGQGPAWTGQFRDTTDAEDIELE